MAEEVQGEEVAAVETEAPTEVVQEEVTLASDEVKFDMPTKFEGKSAEEIAKSYMELEKLKGGDTSQEEKAEEPAEESPKQDEEQYQKYADALDKNGKLSDAEYAELAVAGYDKEAVDTEIQRRADLQDFNSFKENRTLNDMLEPLGGGADKFKEVSDWANSTKTEAEMKEFNSILSSVPKVAQQAMLKGLYEDYASSVTASDSMLHTNSTQTQPNKGYNTQEEFFKDVGSPEYQNNPAYREAVERKMSKSNIF